MGVFRQRGFVTDDLHKLYKLTTMKKIIILILFIYPLSLLSQVQPPDPPNEIAGDAKITGTLQVGDIPIITSDTYQIVVDANGNFGYYGVAPTISCNISTTLFEYGTVNSITVTGHATNPIAATLTEDSIADANNSTKIQYVLDGSNNYSQAIFDPFSPVYGSITSNTYTTSMDWVSGANSGTATASRAINACYPYFYGASSQNFYLDTTALYTTLTKWVKADDPTITITGQDIDNEYLWFGWPIAYDTITEVFYNNGATNWLTDFYSDTVTVNSWSLDDNWDDVEYIFLRTKGLKIGIVNSTWDFNQ